MKIIRKIKPERRTRNVYTNLRECQLREKKTT